MNDSNDKVESRRFAIAVSFPGEHRRFVKNVVKRLAEVLGKDRVFYDAWYESELVGLDGDLKLRRYYREQSEMVIPFFSEHYKKPWCEIEWHAIRAMLKDRRSEDAVVPVEMDGTQIEGWESIDFGIRKKNRSGKVIADLILAVYHHRHGRGDARLPATIDKSPHKPNHAKIIAPSRLLDLGVADRFDELVGRETELGLLTEAWEDDATRVLIFVAEGGVGKTSLVADWMMDFVKTGWQGVDAFFDWSFYSQGTRDQTAANSGLFFDAALRHFGEIELADSPASADQKADKLAECIARTRTLLILDGVEPLQHPKRPGGLEGRFKDTGIERLLKRLAQMPSKGGLCVVTTRVPVVDLNRFHGATVTEHLLNHLSEKACAQLLHQAGACRAGQANIAPDDQELLDTASELKGHALAAQLLGGYLKVAQNGDIRRRDHVDWKKAFDEQQEGHAWSVMQAYERWFEQQGHTGQQHLAALRLLGFFDRPASADCLDVLRNGEAIVGLTESLSGVSREDWNTILARLAGEHRLISMRDQSSPIDAHPLVREYFAVQLYTQNEAIWIEGHRRLFEHLCKTTEHQPDTLDGLQPLYQAVAHGCLAGLHEQAMYKVYVDRILRGTGADGAYSWKNLGAVGADLGAVACFFDPPWTRLSPNLSPADQAWLLNQAAIYLAVLGRLTESLKPARLSMDMCIEQKDWKEAAIRASNLSGSELKLGQITAAVSDAKQSMAFADRGQDAFGQMCSRVTHAAALHEAGRLDEARRLFAEAEHLQADRQKSYPRLYSTQGFQYCDLLLSDAERQAWQQCLQPTTKNQEPTTAVASCDNVAERAQGAQRAWREIFSNDPSLLTTALDHLISARAALYKAILTNSAPASSLSPVENAVDGLRQADAMDQIPRGLLTRAWFRFLQDDPIGCEADLAEVQDIAERGSMRLFLADCFLTRARLFRDRDALEQAIDLLKDLRAKGYHRRDGELADANEAAKIWEKEKCMTEEGTAKPLNSPDSTAGSTEAALHAKPEPLELTFTPPPEGLGDGALGAQSAPGGPVRLTPWQMLGVFVFCVFASIGAWFVNPVVSFVLLSLAAAFGTFGLLTATAVVENRFGKFGSAAAVFVTTLLILLEYGPYEGPRVGAKDTTDIQGIVTVDGHPATAGEIRLLGTPMSDNSRLLTNGNPGYFEFKGLSGIGGMVRLQIDVKAPVDLPKETQDYPVKPGELLKIDLKSPPEPAPAVPVVVRPAPLVPSLSGAKPPLKEKFVGRVKELTELDAAWDSAIHSQSPQRTVGIIAWGGFGKTALVREWLYHKLERDGWPDNVAPGAVFWQTFEKNANPEHFLQDIICYFSEESTIDLANIPTARQRFDTLRKVIGRRTYVIILDGLEIFQSHARGDRLGEVYPGFLRVLLTEHTAGRLGNGLCIVTSRLPLQDLRSYRSAIGPYIEIDLEKRELNDDEVRRLFEIEGLNSCSNEELRALINVCGLHPLALKTMANLLVQYRGGEASRWKELPEVLAPPEGHKQERQLWRVLSWYDSLLKPAELHVMGAISHFREPVREEWLTHLLVAEGLDRHIDGPISDTQKDSATEAITASEIRDKMSRGASTQTSLDHAAEELILPGHRLTSPELRSTLTFLVGLKLLRQQDGLYSSHALVKEHFRSTIAKDQPGLTAEIHRRIYNLYGSKIQPVSQPDTLEGLHPLYEAIYHGCEAGLHQLVFDKTYQDRILRGTSQLNGFYSTRQLGAIEADLGAVACFFEQPWIRPSAKLSIDAQVWLLNQAALRLKNMGQLADALEPMRVALASCVEHEYWKAAATASSNLSELELALGEVFSAVTSGSQSVDYADRSGDAFQRMGKRTTHAEALHYAGCYDEAYKSFSEAERLQAERQPTYPRLYSLWGIRHYNLLLSRVEHAAWKQQLQRPGLQSSRAAPLQDAMVSTQEALLAICNDVTEGIEENQREWSKIFRNKRSKCDLAMEFLILGRASLYWTVLEHAETSDLSSRLKPCAVHLTAAVDGLRKAGKMDYLPRGLLARAWLRFLRGDPTGCEADLAEVQDIAERGPMPPFMADCLLTRARLFRDRAALDQAAELLTRLQGKGYHRRDQELADAIEASKAW